MQQLAPQDKENFSPDPDIAVLREQAAVRLEEIAERVRNELAGSGIEFPFYLLVPSGRSVVTIFTPEDPTDAEWKMASKIVRTAVEELVGLDNPASRDLPCALIKPCSQHADLGHASE